MKLLLDPLLQDRIPVTLIQILNQTLMAQSPDGSWGLDRSPETTTYAVLILKSISSIPWADNFVGDILSAVQRGQHFLNNRRGCWTEPQYLWIGKVLYGLPTLSEAYCLAATNYYIRSYIWTENMKASVETPKKAAAKVSHVFYSLQVLQPEPFWKIRACVYKVYCLSHL